MADKIYEWDKLERMYVTDELKNLKEVAKASGASKRFVEKQSSMRKWKKKKQDFKDKVGQAIEKEIIKEQVSEAKKARTQLLGIADLLLNQGVQRFIDQETGKPMKNAIHNMQTAITGISVGSRIKTDLLGLKQQDEEKGETNIYQNIQNQNNNFEGATDAELEEFIAYCRRRLGFDGSGCVPGKAKKKGGKK
jgi:hypothetical protein